MVLWHGQRSNVLARMRASRGGGDPNAAEMDKRAAGQCSYAGYCAMFPRIEMGWDAARWDHKTGDDEDTKTIRMANASCWRKFLGYYMLGLGIASCSYTMNGGFFPTLNSFSPDMSSWRGRRAKEVDGNE
uniref:Uncharacterized protein n=1 Tax=Oryza barthii TaxID=65489 RepID=A0A0D3HBE7_9ORYZ